jgi:hypothetical protein
MTDRPLLKIALNATPTLPRAPPKESDWPMVFRVKSSSPGPA